MFRAEATFVGLGIWDLYSTIVTPGARTQWDRSYEDAVLLEDVNELSEVWHWKSRPIWPAKYVSPCSMLILHHHALFPPSSDDRFPTKPWLLGLNSRVFVPQSTHIRTAEEMPWYSRQCINPPRPSMCSRSPSTTCPYSRSSLPSAPPRFVPKSTCKDGLSRRSHLLRPLSPFSNNRIPKDGLTRIASRSR